jgi:hypothetical protein
MMSEFINYGKVFAPVTDRIVEMEDDISNAIAYSQSLSQQIQDEAMDALNQKSPRESTLNAPDLIISDKTYEQSNPAKRPHGWADVKLERIQAKEAALKKRGKPSDRDALDKEVKRISFLLQLLILQL